MLELKVPRSFKGANVTHFYNKVRADIDEHFDPFSIEKQQVNFDFMNLGFIEPDGVVTISNLVKYCEWYNYEIFYSYPKEYVARPRSFRAIDYLDDSLFFEKIFGTKLHPGSSPRDTTNGIEFLSTDRFNKSYVDETIAWIKTNVHLQDKSFGQLDTALSEIFNNIIDHSASAIGGTVFAQHYPSLNKITLCISDFGIGIANKIKTKFPIENDWDAIVHATKPKVTTASTPRNRGMGLDNLVNIMMYNQGSVKIVSNWGEFEYNYRYSDSIYPGKISAGETDDYYQGTLITLNFRTDTLEVEEEEEFEW